MVFSEHIYRDVLVAVIQAKGATESITELIEDTVDAVIAADQKLSRIHEEINIFRQDLTAKATAKAN